MFRSCQGWCVIYDGYLVPEVNNTFVAPNQRAIIIFIVRIIITIIIISRQELPRTATLIILMF
jgi:hypothetical protein